MSGHSKWSKIKHKKGRADKARGQIFTKLCRAITLAAREGGGDVDMNFSLRLAILKAKSENVPKDNIERAIKKGTGADKDGAQIQEVLYEGFGPSGVGILVDTMTDNTNRTVSEVKHALTRFGGSLGGPGSVTWQFEKKGVIRFTSEKKQDITNWDDFQLELMDAGADDIIDESEGVEIISSVENYKKVISKFEEANIDPDETGLVWLPKDIMKADQELSETISNIIEALEELDDVREVYTNI